MLKYDSEKIVLVLHKFLDSFTPFVSKLPSKEIYICGDLPKKALLWGNELLAQIHEIGSLDLVVLGQASLPLDKFILGFTDPGHMQILGIKPNDYFEFAINIKQVNSLADVMEYNYDGLFYNIKTEQILDLGFNESLGNLKCFNPRGPQDLGRRDVIRHDLKLIRSNLALPRQEVSQETATAKGTYNYFIAFMASNWDGMKVGNTVISRDRPITSYDDIQACELLIQNEFKYSDKPIITNFILMNKIKESDYCNG